MFGALYGQGIATNPTVLAMLARLDALEEAAERVCKHIMEGLRTVGAGVSSSLHDLAMSRGLAAPAGDWDERNAALRIPTPVLSLQPLLDPFPEPRCTGSSRGQRDRAAQHAHSVRPVAPRAQQRTRRPRRSARWAAR